MRRVTLYYMLKNDFKPKVNLYCCSESYNDHFVMRKKYHNYCADNINKLIAM